MLYILLGKHYFAKQSYVDDLAIKNNVVVTRYFSETLPQLQSLIQPSLFSKSGIIVMDGCLNKAEIIEYVPTLVESKDIFVIIEEKVDKRKTEITKILNLPGIVIQDFPVPHGSALVEWIGRHVKELDGNIAKPAAAAIVRLLGGESTDPRFEVDIDLWQIHNELKKLVTYANGKEITEEMVVALMRNEVVPEIWDVIDAIAKKQPAKILSLVQDFLDSKLASDEKSKIILLNASLADQLRSLLFYKSANQSGMGEGDILKVTGWKSGRLFIVKRNSQAFSELQLVDFLKKLEALDFELKTGSVPPRVMVDLILSQI